MLFVELQQPILKCGQFEEVAFFGKPLGRAAAIRALAGLSGSVSGAYASHETQYQPEYFPL